MSTIASASGAFEWGTSYELELFRDGRWIISAVFDGRGEALEEARRLDRVGEMVRLRAEECDAMGNSRGIRTVFVSGAVKTSWTAERERIAQLGRRQAAEEIESEVDSGMELEEPTVNPYALLGIFTLVAFGGVGAILALRELYAVI
jgi:hypothetical protein